MKIFALLLTLCLLLAPEQIQAGAKKSPTISIRLHGEGSATDGPSFSSEVQLNNPPAKIFMRNVPVTSERDITGFYPLPGSDGQFGAYFRLDAHGANKLQQFTVEEKGRTAIVLINGRIAANMKISAPVKDGILYVPSGISREEILILEKKFPLMGSEFDFGKKARRATSQNSQQ